MNRRTAPPSTDPPPAIDDQGVSAEVALDLLRRYDRPGPRYTSYPTAVEFSPALTEGQYRERLAEADRDADAPLSLYVHVPFCEHRCTYCGCHVVITRDGRVAERYLDHLFAEIDLLAEALPHRRRVSQLHWGGGTPTYLTPAQITELHRRLTAKFRLEQNAEVAIEVDPRVTTDEQLRLLRELGFNRISLGVQDMSPEVQRAVGRDQTEAQTRATFARCRELGFDSVNLDLIYGLPEQTPERFAATVQAVLALQPDRVALYSFAYVPGIRAHQKRIDPATLPEPETKLRLFCEARERFLGAGYRQVGMDHFALPGDDMVTALDRGELHRNFMGYMVRKGSDMLGLGVSAIGDVRGVFAQNEKKLSRYYRALQQGRFPIEKGYVLSADDRIRREVIAGILCNFRVVPTEIERRFGIDFAAYFAPELADLAAADGLVEHGFVRLGPRSIDVVGAGRLFVRNVAMVFDAYLRFRAHGRPVFSRTV